MLCLQGRMILEEPCAELNERERFRKATLGSTSFSGDTRGRGHCVLMKSGQVEHSENIGRVGWRSGVMSPCVLRRYGIL